MARECLICHRTFQDKMSHCPFDGSLLVRSAEPGEDLYINAILHGKYRIEEKLGEGGMCNIYRATTLDQSQQVCAIKLLRNDLASDEASVWRFRNEIQAAGIIDHPNVVKLLDAEQGSNGMYMVMELLEGVTLKQEIQRGPFGLERMHRVVKQLCDALDATHAKGVIHRDLKPDNIMLIKRGNEQDVVKLFDFGIAKITTEKKITGQLVPSHIVMGTPRYMSPEQCHGHAIDSRSDIYSLGVIIYEMLAGVPPYTDQSARVLLSKITQEPVPSLKRRRPNLPSIVERVVLHALEKSPLKRPQTARELAEEMENAVTADPSISPEQMQQVLRPNLVPVVKQVSGQISVVEYRQPSQETESKPKPKPANPLFTSGQIKTSIKQDWPYWAIGIILFLSLIIIILLIFIFTSKA